MIKKFDRYINEGYREVDQINLLANDIIEYFSRMNGDMLENINKRGKMVAKDFVFELPSDKLYNIILDINDAYKIKYINKYTNKIKNFIENSKLYIIFTNKSGRAGGYDDENKEIIINLTIMTFVESLRSNGVLLNTLKPSMYIDILKKSMKQGLKRSLTHELQHAYDDYISNGKYDTDKLSNKFYSDTPDIGVKYDPNFTERDYYKTYLNLPHEYWARFSETLSMIDKYINFNDLFNQFTNLFIGYDNLPEKGKKRILNSLYKYYDSKKDNKQLIESVRDLMKPKSDDEILKSIGDLSPEKLLKKSYEIGYLNGIKLALKKGAKLDNNYAIILASKKGYTEIVEFLLKERRVDPSIDNNDAIIDASCNGYTDIVKLLLQDPRVDPSESDNYAIRYTSENGFTEIVRLLLQDPRVDPSDINNSAIRHASQNGHIEIVKLLLQDKKVDPSDDDNYAIKYASDSGHLEVVKLLLNDKRVDPSDNNNYAIKYSSEHGYTEIVELLLQDKKVDPSDDNNYAIEVASQNGHLEVVKLLLQDERVDPSAYDNYAIRYASDSGYLEVIKVLLQDPRVDPSDINNSAIRHASQNGHIEIVKLLLQDKRVREKLTDEKIKKYEKK